MPRQWKRKTNRGVPAEVSAEAAEKLREEGNSEKPHEGYRSSQEVFSEEQEELVAEYLKEAADMYYGLNPQEVRKFAYQLAVQYKCKHPQSWDKNSMAGPHWFSSFMKRQPNPSIRSAQPTSLSQATSFTRTNVERFFKKLGDVIEKHGLDGNHIWNVDETGVTTVQAPDRIIARRGVKQVGAMTSGERGVLVSVACAVNAMGNAIPPAFVFPRKRYKERFLVGGPPGSVGCGNDSGWMQEEEFLFFLKHFVKHTKATPQRKVLLLLDNHSSRISVQAINYCKENGIVLLTFPPHCSHKLQPLDRSVYGPFKKMINTSSGAWMRRNPAKTMSIYNIPSLVKTAFPLAATPSNIQAGFRCTGIWPFNPDIFQECDYAPSQVTDRPDPSASPATSAHQLDQASTSTTLAAEASSSANLEAQGFSPSVLRPFPKAGARKNRGGKRKKLQSEVFTDTPVKQAREEEEKKRSSAKKKIMCQEQKKKMTSRKKAAIKRPKPDADSQMEDHPEKEKSETGSIMSSAEVEQPESNPGSSHQEEQIQQPTDHRPEKGFHCQLCGKRFDRLYCWKRHQKIHTGEKPYSCDHCGKTFTQSGNLKKHQRIHSGEKPYSCDSCGKTFTQPGNLKKHQRIHTGEKPYSCDHCGKRFRHLDHWACHQRIHTGEKPYSCGRCGKRFTQAGPLKAHQRVHTGEKPFSCNICDKRFTLSGDLMKHQRIHTGEKPYSCDRCGKRFTYSFHVKTHQRIHTGEKPFSCRRCGKKFTYSFQLKRHWRIHTGEKPFSCRRCGKKFTYSFQLKTHWRIHTGERPFVCKICGKRFNQFANVMIHQHVHGRKRQQQRSNSIRS